MSLKLVQLIIQELGALNYNPQGEKRIIIHCPFHNDNNPSLIVPLFHEKYRPGQFKCFSCGAKGDWNKLAEKLRLKSWDQHDQTKYYDKSKKEYAEEDAFKDLAFALNKVETKQEVRSLSGIEELPTDFSWRGIPREFWVSHNFSYYWDKKKDEFYLYSSVTMNDQILGYTLAAMTPSEKNPKYQTFAPTNTAILMYDFIKPDSTIVIVEGHFDAWRMRYYGFEVGAMIGTENWSQYKTDAIIAKRPKRIIILTDGDEPGYKAGEMLANTFLEKYIDTIWYKFPFFPKPDSLDAGNMPIEYIEDLKRYII